MNSTNYRAFFKRRAFGKKSSIVLLILAILTGSFIVQTRFIVSENKRLAESTIDGASPVAQNAETTPEIAESDAPNPTVNAMKPLSDELQDSSAPQNSQTVKIVLKNSNRQIENLPARSVPINKNKSTSNAERLRRAEKILTGF